MMEKLAACATVRGVTAVPGRGTALVASVRSFTKAGYQPPALSQRHGGTERLEAAWRIVRRHREDSTMKSHRTLVVVLTVAISLGALLAVAPGAGSAAETPRRGGVLLAAIAADAPSLDPHQEQTFATIELVAQCYSTLLQIDPYNYPKVIGDVATEWKIAPDGLTYTFKLRQGIRFHDGSTLTSADVKATYEKIVFPPTGVRSIRKTSYAAISSIETP